MNAFFLFALSTCSQLHDLIISFIGIEPQYGKQEFLTSHYYAKLSAPCARTDNSIFIPT